MQVLFSLLIILSCFVCTFRATTCPTTYKPCATCIEAPIGPSSALIPVCLTCKEGYTKYIYYCYEDCDDGQFFYQLKCYACDAACATCSQYGQCLTCSTSYPLAYTTYCYSTCPAATFQSSSTTCQDCPTYCASCTSASYCSACQNGKYMYQNLCYAVCPDGTYGDSNFQCQPCSSTCKTCKSNTICQSCITNYLLYNSQCLSVCPDKAYANSPVCSSRLSFCHENNEKLGCPSGCATCTSSSFCSTCESQFYSSNNLCVATCPAGTYGNQYYQCLSCGTGCSSCASSTSCLKCNSGYFMSNYQCYPSCPASTFQFDSSSCADCVAGCAICSASKQCTTCASPYTSYSGTCAQATGSESDPTDGCFGQITSCEACLSDSTCSYCDSGYYLSGNTCKSSCPAGTFARDYACKSCLSNCAQCSRLTTCDACSGGYNLFEGNQCLSTCPVGYYSASGICTACPTNCASCTGASACTTCQGSYLFSEGSCVTTCPAKTYHVLGKCTSCSDYCTTCGDGALCTVCETGWNLINNVCSDKCPTGFYKENGACQGCPTGCTNCTDATTCEACDNGYVFYENTCPFKCPEGLYNASGICQNCITGCRLCNSETVCLQCAVEYVYFNQTCLTTCPDGYYDLDAICTVCPTGCTTCTNASFCQSCAYGYNIHLTDVCALDITAAEIAEVKGLAATSEATSTASDVLSSIYAFMNSGDPTAMFMGSLAKMLQYVKYINIEYPPKIKLMFGLQSNVNDTSESIITKVQEKIEISSDSSTLADNFGYYGLTSSFLSNCLKSLGILAGILAGIGANYLILYLISPMSKIHQICKSLMGILKWNLFLLMFCGQVGDIVFFSSFEFEKANFENALSVVSFVVCILMNFLSIFVFYKLIQVNMNLQKSRKARIARRHEGDFLKDAESKWESCKVLFDSYKNKKFSQQAFMIFFLIRILSFYLIIAYFSAYPFFQIITITIISLLIVTYLIIVRPFKSILNNINQIVFELIIFAFNGCVLILAELDTSNSDNYLLRKKLDTIMLDINLVAGFVSTAFVLLKTLVVVRDIYRDWKLKKEAKNPNLKFRKNRLANRKAQNANNNSAAIINPDIFITNPDLSSQNIINLETMTIMNMDQTYDNQSFDFNPLDQKSLRNHRLQKKVTSYTPSSSSVNQGNDQRDLGYQEDQEENMYQRNQEAMQRMRIADFQSNNQRQRIKKSSILSSKKIQKRAKNFSNVAKQILQDGQVWEEIEENPSNLGKQTREYDPNKARIRRIQKQNQISGIDVIGL